MRVLTAVFITASLMTDNNLVVIHSFSFIVVFIQDRLAGHQIPLRKLTVGCHVSCQTRVEARIEENSWKTAEASPASGGGVICSYPAA